MVGHGQFSHSFMLKVLFTENLLLYEPCLQDKSGILDNPLHSLYKHRPGCPQHLALHTGFFWNVCQRHRALLFYHLLRGVRYRREESG